MARPSERHDNVEPVILIEIYDGETARSLSHRERRAWRGLEAAVTIAQQDAYVVAIGNDDVEFAVPIDVPQRRPVGITCSDRKR